MDLSKILSIVFRYIWLLVVAGLVASLTTYYQYSSRPVEYSATTDLLVGPSLNSANPDLNALKIGGQMTLTYAEVVNTPSFLESVNNKLAQKTDLNDLRDAISTRQSTDTRVLTIMVSYPDPKQAIAIANAAAQTLLEMSPSKENTAAMLRTQMSEQTHQLENIISDSQSRIAQLEMELAALKEVSTLSAETTNTNTDQQALASSQSRITQLEAELTVLREANPLTPEATRLNLEQQSLVLRQLAEERSLLPEAASFNLEQQSLVIRQLAEERSRLSDALRTLATIYQILLDTNTNQIEILQPAMTATLIDQQLWLRVFSSALGGLIFALIVVFAVEYFDDRLRFPGDLSKAAGVPLLSTIGKHAQLKETGLARFVTFARPESDAASGYREAVAKLLFSIGESIPYTLLLSSAGSKTGDEAAMTAGNLAVAFAQAGYKVVLVDAQMDRPVLTTMFQAERREGLADLMIAKSEDPQLLPVEQAPGIRFLPVGLSSEKISHTMMNPAKLGALFERLQKAADIVLVASSEISRSAESLTLASKSNAVVLVARHAEARGKVVAKLVENLRLMKINLAGVIFDYNAWPSVSKADHRAGSALGRPVTTEVLAPSNLSEQTTKS